MSKPDPRETATHWARLRNARIPQLLGVYVGVSFAVLQGGDILVERLGLPNWTFFGLAILLLAGIPVLVVTALVQQARRAEEGRAAEAALMARAGGEAPPGVALPEPFGSRRRLQAVFTWSNSGFAGVGALALLALLVAGFMTVRARGIGPLGTLVAAGVIDREEPILIAEFQEGIKAVLLGEIIPAGRGSIVSVRLISTATEEALVSFRESVSDPGELIPAVDRRSNRLRERIGESLRSIRGSESQEQVSTASLPALRHHSQGVRAIDMERDLATGITLLEEAIARDSTFAMAWRKVGVALMNGGYPAERWRGALPRAYENRDRLTDRERYLTQGTYFSHVADDPDRAIASYRALIDRYPQETAGLNNLAVIVGNRGDRAGAAELYERAIEAGLMRISLVHGRLEEEARHQDRAEDLQRRMGWELAPERRAFQDLQRRFMVLADTVGTLAGLDELVPRGDALPPEAGAEGAHLEVAGLLLALGEVERAQNLIRGWDALDLEPRDRERLQFFRQDAGARLAAADGDLAAALAAYEAYLDRPWYDRLQADAFLLPRTHERLAALYEAREDLANGIWHLERFVQLWEDADPPLQPRVERARRRLTALAGS